MKRSVLFVIVVSLFFYAARGFSQSGEVLITGDTKPVAFREVWAYLMQGEETRITGSEPFTDVCYFSAGINYKGKLTGPKNPPLILIGGKVRAHLVITELSNSSLSHFCLNPALPYRAVLIDDIVEFSTAFQGVQIDFESVSGDDRENFAGFLRDLRGRLATEKILSVALPARRKEIVDAYQYSLISSIADRIIIMAYDQHWSTSAPGPVASLWWCREVTEYAKSKISPDKLIMGIPLYSRAWQDKKLSRALSVNSLEEIKRTINPAIQVCDQNGPFFTYKEDVTVTVYFDDIDSLYKKLKHYAGENIQGVSFWRIGQGSPGLWDYITTF